MSTKYNIKDVDFMNYKKYYFLLNVMTQRAQKDPSNFMKLFGIDDFSKDRYLDVKVTINNIEVDFEHFITSIENQMNQRVNEQAAILLKEGVKNKMEAIYDSLNKIDSNLNSLVKEVLPAWETSSQDC